MRSSHLTLLVRKIGASLAGRNTHASHSGPSDDLGDGAAFLVPESTIAQRLAHAKNKIAEAPIGTIWWSRLRSDKRHRQASDFGLFRVHAGRAKLARMLASDPLERALTSRDP